MHDHFLVPGQYWACHQPERPHSGFICYDDGCDKCLLAAKAAILAGNGGVVEVDSLTPDRIVRLKDWYDRAMMVAKNGGAHVQEG